LSSPPPPPTKKLRTTSHERRRWRRRKPGPGVVCQLLSGGVTAATGLLNVAEGGAGVESHLPLTAGDRLTLLLFNRACLGSLTVEARVVWSAPAPGGSRAGLCFEAPLRPDDLLPFLS
jgi:hypothetical protein